MIWEISMRSRGRRIFHRISAPSTRRCPTGLEVDEIDGIGITAVPRYFGARDHFVHTVSRIAGDLVHKGGDLLHDLRITAIMHHDGRCSTGLPCLCIPGGHRGRAVIDLARAQLNQASLYED